jgi:hypothetical protein
VSGPVMSYHEYARTLMGLAKEAADAKAELLAAHQAEAEAERAYRIRRAQAYTEVEAPAAGQRDALVDSLSADARKDRDIARGRVNVAQEALRDIRSRRSSGDELARFARRAMELDTPGPDTAPLTRIAA